MTTQTPVGQRASAGAEEVDLRRGQLLGRVGDEDSALVRASAPSVTLPWAESRPPTPGVSTSARPVRSSRCGSRTSTDCEPAPPRRVRGLADQVHEPVDVHRLRDRLSVRPAGVAGRLQQRDRRRLLAVPDEGRHGGDDVGVHRAHVGLQQGVDQRALAALELADDGHREQPRGQPLAGGGQVRAEVRAALLLGHAAALVEGADGVPHRPQARRLEGRRGRLAGLLARRAAGRAGRAGAGRAAGVAAQPARRVRQGGRGPGAGGSAVGAGFSALSGTGGRRWRGSRLLLPAGVRAGCRLGPAICPITDGLRPGRDRPAAVARPGAARRRGRFRWHHRLLGRWRWLLGLLRLGRWRRRRGRLRLVVGPAEVVAAPRAELRARLVLPAARAARPHRVNTSSAARARR